jgi:hypothetical protein
MRKTFRFFPSILTICFFWMMAMAPTAHAGIAETFGLSPFWKWREIETAHFRITFPEELADTAERAANDLEEANSVLSKKLYWQSPRKVPILLIDNTDSANGITSPEERFGIVLYVTPPDDWFSTAYYDDWLRMLCFHEYTHFLNMDATRGLYAPARYLFGDILLPNAAWPSWMLEGLAVYDETRYTHGGRGRSPFYEMILRTAVDEGVFNTGKHFTLDRINSLSVPYYPAGEAVYLFGYEMMKEVAKDNHAGLTSDGANRLKSGEDALGVMSYRSSWRIPYFINGNLENITGRDWYSYWDQFVRETQDRTSKELAQIKAQPFTQPKRETQGAYQVVGSAYSPDGRWLAYTSETLDQLNSLYIRDLQSGKDRLIEEKIAGAQLAFTADSKHVVFSSLRKESEYYLLSELGIYSIDSGETNWVTFKKRARDPDVSHDGKSVVFTVADGQKVGVAIAELIPQGQSFVLGNIREIYTAGTLDAASSPKFSKDDQTVYFTLHPNGALREDLMAVELGSGHMRTLFANGKFNRYPAVSKNGDLIFVSDWTGVDNLYRYRDGKTPEMLTNLTSGVSFPSFDQDGKIHGAVFYSSGWDLAQIDPLEKPISPDQVAIAPAPIPSPDQDSDPKHLDKKYPVEPYSVIPSIWPRTWVPYANFTPGNFSFGDLISGFDATDRHRYTLDIGYDTLSQKADWSAQYQNRTLGPTFSFFAGNSLSTANYSGGSIYTYTRDTLFSIDALYPFFWTYSYLTPELTFNLDKTYYYYPGFDTPTANFDYQTKFLPSVDVIMSHSSAEKTRLGISSEEGRDLTVGSRVYLDNGNGTETAKGLIADKEYLRLGNSHFVLVPSVQASYTTANPATNRNLNSDVVLQGLLPVLIGGFPNTSLSSLPIRGYPGMTFYVKSAVVSSLDLRFPLADIFRGWGTNPFFLDQIYGFVFGEATYLPDGANFFRSSSGPKSLPSTGGGLTASMEAFVDLPIAISLEYHYGFQADVGGGGEVFTALSYSGLNF